MRKLVILGVCVVSAALTVSAAGRELPDRFVPSSLDEGLVSLYEPVGARSWSAWAYRNGAEYDLAIAWTDEHGVWNEPWLVGVGDGIDQKQPAMATDAAGNLFVVWTSAKRIQLMVVGSGMSWSAPRTISAAGELAHDPALRVVGDRLVVAYRSAGRIRLLDFALGVLASSEANSVWTIIDNPDPVENFHEVRGTAAEARRDRIGESEDDRDDVALNSNVGPHRD
jgi:hypothetical protein